MSPRLSWLISYLEMNENDFDDKTPLGDLYAKVRSLVPTQREHLLEIDGDEKKVSLY